MYVQVLTGAIFRLNCLILLDYSFYFYLKYFLRLLHKNFRLVEPIFNETSFFVS